MLTSKHEAAHPDVKFVVNRVGPLLISRAHLQPGQWVETFVPACAGYAEIDNVSFQELGTTIDDNAPSPELALAPRHAGWWSRDCRDALAEGRIVRRLAITPVVQWCIRSRNPAVSIADLQLVRLPAGDVHHFAPGDNALVATGALRFGERSLGPSTHLCFRTDDGAVIAHEDTRFFLWKQ